MQNAVKNIDMTIEAAPGRQLSSDGDPPKTFFLYLYCQILVRNDNQTQTESVPKSKLRKIAESQMLPVQSRRAELVPCAFRTIRYKKRICPRNEIIKRVN